MWVRINCCQVIEDSAHRTERVGCYSSRDRNIGCLGTEESAITAFCPHGSFVPRMLCLRMFCPHGCFVPTDVLSGGRFCLCGRFVPPDVLSLYVMSPDVLSGHGSAYIGRHVIASRCWTLPRKKEVAWHPPLLLLATGLRHEKPLPKRLPLNHHLCLAAHDVLQLVGVLL
jgi:hypothetical protein